MERAGGVIVKFEGDSDDEEPEVEYEVEVDDETTPTKKKIKKMTRLSRNERQRRRAEAQAVQECDILVTHGGAMGEHMYKRSVLTRRSGPLHGSTMLNPPVFLCAQWTSCFIIQCLSVLSMVS